MLPTGLDFIAHCPLLTISLPTGLDRKQQNTRLHGNNSSGRPPTALAHCPLFKHRSQKGFRPVGSGQDSPYSYGVMLALPPSGVEAPAFQTSRKETKGTANEQE